MRSLLIGLIIFIFMLCNKDKENTCPAGLEEGRIIGMDFRKCACCSGWWIEVGADTLRSFTLPANIEIDNTNIVDGISVPVCLSYEKATECNLWEELIDIKEMNLQ